MCDRRILYLVMEWSRLTILSLPKVPSANLTRLHLSAVLLPITANLSFLRTRHSGLVRWLFTLLLEIWCHRVKLAWHPLIPSMLFAMGVCIYHLKN